MTQVVQKDKRDIHLSKALSYLLRHAAVKENLTIDSNGYTPVKELLTHNRLKTHKCTVDDIHRIVKENDKQRFHIKTSGAGEEWICATQGHSIKSIQPSDEVLVPITEASQLPQELIHGTNLQSTIKIIESGAISPMSRNHVHLSPGMLHAKGVISGMRSSSSVYIFIDLRSPLFFQTLKLFRSLNNVYLSSSIPIQLIEKVVVKENLKDEKNLDTLRRILHERNIPLEKM
ncbi:tRNA 2'-phosphotransferase [Saccharomyces paradoxus]|uniref:2'-phosphotransferase n=1 Tax=Saccharomyces paradoxus TaxID=27291 RepID=A0A8B8UZB4_SACPA|nr:Tpt1 [Saccharomyces paradoxus]QHS76024.1 Tpt1 [Saccharomyces paradoxus]